MSPPLAALTVGLLVVTGLLCARFAFRAPPPAAERRARAVQALVVAGGRRLLFAGLAAVVIAAVVRWPVAALAAFALTAGWPWLFASDSAPADRARVEGIAKWLEDLRDVVRGSSVTVEDGLERVAERPPTTLDGPLRRFALRRRQGFPIADALAELADDIAHPTADAAIAAMLLTTSGGAGGARLWNTFDELAEAARDEVRVRDANDRLRAIYQRSMRRLVVLVLAIIGGLVVLSPDLLAEYRTVAGQVWLVLPFLVFGGCLVWLRQLCRYDLGARYRLRLEAVAP